VNIYIAHYHFEEISSAINTSIKLFVSAVRPSVCHTGGSVKNGAS